jgi:hypothetical protein
MNTHHNHWQRMATHLSWKIFVASCVLSLVSAPMASAASSWSPTLLVNTESFQTIDSGDGTTNRELRFGDTNTERMIYEIGAQRFRLTRSLHVSGNITATGSISAVGTVSGAYVKAVSGLSSSGTLVFEGAASGSSLFLGTSLRGAGLADCDAASQTLQWDATTGRFSCATITASASFGSGNVITIGDGRYVNTSGDTMTGALTIDVAGEGTTALSVSGTLLFNDSGLNNDARFEGESDQNLFFLDASTDRIGIGTSAPETKLEVVGALSGLLLRISGNAEIHGALSASGAIRTDNNLTINDDQTAADAVVTFGSDGTNETLTFANSADRFEFSDDVRTTGNLSGSTLTVDGNLNLRGQTYSFPTSQPSTGGYLRTDGAGNLTWSNNLGYGSGDILSFHPEYPNAIYFGSGSAQVGQLTLSGGTTDLDNSYVWTSSNAAIQDYWISVRVQVPANFNSWDPVAALQFRYKTASASAAVNHLTVRMKDTAGTDVALTGGSALASTSWTTASITGPASGGTWTPGGYATVYVKVAATNAGNAAAGFLNFRWETRR